MTTYLYTHHFAYTDEVSRLKAIEDLKRWRDDLKLERPYTERWEDPFVYDNWVALILVCRAL